MVSRTSGRAPWIVIKPASQRVAAKIGLVDGGKLTVKYPDGTVKKGVSFVLPGMENNMTGLVVDLSKRSA